MHAVIHAADVQDRDGGVLVMATLFGLYPFLLKLYADGGYQGPQFKAALQRVTRQLQAYKMPHEGPLHQSQGNF
jgi:hypothetical protein